MRNVLALVQKAQSQMVATLIRTVFAQADHEAVESQLKGSMAIPVLEETRATTRWQLTGALRVLSHQETPPGGT